MISVSALIAIAAFIVMIIVGKYLFGPLVYDNTMSIHRGGAKQTWVFPLFFIFCVLLYLNV